MIARTSPGIRARGSPARCQIISPQPTSTPPLMAMPSRVSGAASVSAPSTGQIRTSVKSRTGKFSAGTPASASASPVTRVTPAAKRRPFCSDVMDRLPSC